MSTLINSNIDVVVYALWKLGGVTRKVPSEHIAFECFSLAPDRFSWTTENFRHLPDKYVAKTALEDAAKAKYGALVQGKYAREESRDGWSLTPSGVRWLQSNRDRIESGLSIPHESAPRLPPLEVRRLRSRLDRSPAYVQFAASGTLEGVSRFMLADLLEASPDAPPDLVRFKFDRLMSIAEMAQETRIIEFLREVESHFSRELNQRGGAIHDEPKIKG